MTNCHRAGKGNLWLIVAVVVVMGMVAVPLYMMSQGKPPVLSDVDQAASQLEANLSAAKVAGVPLTLSDLNPHPPIPPSENAALDYLAAADALGSYEEAGKIRNQLQNEFAEKDYVAAEKVLRGLQKVIDLTYEAAEKPRCDFDRDWDLNPQLSFPELAKSKVLVQILVTRATVFASQGKHSLALKDFAAASKLAAHAGSDPNQIALMLQATLERGVLRGIEHCLAHAKHPEDFNLYLAHMEAYRPKPNVFRAMQGESYITTATIRNLALFNAYMRDKDVKEIDKTKLKRSGMPTDTEGKAFMSRHFEIWSRVLGEAKSKQPESPEIYDILDRQTPKSDAHDQPSYALEIMMNPTIVKAKGNIVALDAVWKATKGLALIMKHKASEGKYPSTLEEIGFTETDPFTQKPFGYLMKGATVRVYSLGEDKADNKGLRSPEMPKGSNEFDLAASFPPMRYMVAELQGSPDHSHD